MRIGILTYHFVVNEGAIWQAYGLCRSIREAYPQHACEIINYCHAGKLAAINALHSEEKIAVSNRVLEPYLAETRIVDHACTALFAHLSETYDLVIVGSDIIWQFDKDRGFFERLCIGRERMGDLHPDRSSPYRLLRDIKNWTLRWWKESTRQDGLKIDFPNAFWLDPEIDARKTTFAASVGYSDIDHIPAEQRAEMTRRLEALDTISVRDEVSERFVNTLVPAKQSVTRQTPDPTWLLDDAPMDIDDAFARAGIDPGERLAGILYPAGRYFGERFNRWVIPHLREKGFKIVSVIDANPLADYNLAAQIVHPFEWWAVIRTLDFLFTVRTHPSIAALKYETPLANVDITAMLNRAAHSKSRDMMTHFGLADFCLYQRNEFTREKVLSLVDQSLEHDWDWAGIAQQREQNRRWGMETLEQIIQP